MLHSTSGRGIATLGEALMAITLLVDEDILPERGTVNLCLNHTFEIRITAEEARRQAKRWLLNEVSYMLTVKPPTLKLSKTKAAVWAVPVILTASHLGEVGRVGVIEVDVATGEMNTTTSLKEALVGQARILADTMPPYRPRTTTPETTLAAELQPTHPSGQPGGSPLDLLPTV